MIWACDASFLILAASEGLPCGPYYTVSERLMHNIPLLDNLSHVGKAECAAQGLHSSNANSGTRCQQLAQRHPISNARTVNLIMFPAETLCDANSSPLRI